MANLRSHLDRQGIPHVADLEADFDVMLLNSWVQDYRTVRDIKRRRPGVRAVHRIDGSARDYGRGDDADHRQARLNLLADATIFQSSYSRHCTREKARIIHQDGVIIPNPVDTEMFTPHGETAPLGPGIKVANVCHSTNPMKGTHHLGELARRCPDVTFVLCGHYPPLPDLPNLRLLGRLPRADVARVLRSCDLFIHLAQNDPCPNVVTEAMASGLPVLYVESGGTPELVGDCGTAVTVESAPAAIDATVRDRDVLSAKARARAESCFSFDQVFPQYLAVLSSVGRRPVPRLVERARLAARGYPVLFPSRSEGRLLSRVARRFARVFRAGGA